MGRQSVFQLIARRYEKTSTVFASNKTFPSGMGCLQMLPLPLPFWIAYHYTVVNIKGKSYKLKERKEFIRQKQQTVNTLLGQGNA